MRVMTSPRILAVLAVCLLLGTAGLAHTAIAPGSDNTLLRTRTGLVVTGYVDACKVARIDAGQIAIGDGSLVVPTVFAYLDNRQRVSLAEEEGGVDQVAQSIVNAQPACHRVTLSEEQLQELADLIGGP